MLPRTPHILIRIPPSSFPPWIGNVRELDATVFARQVYPGRARFVKDLTKSERPGPVIGARDASRGGHLGYGRGHGRAPPRRRHRPARVPDRPFGAADAGG